MKEMMRILIAYDDSEYARAAIDDLLRAGLPPEADALIVSVADVALPPSVEVIENGVGLTSRRVLALVAQVQAQAGKELSEAHAHATDGCERVRALFPDWRVEAATLTGTPSWEIIKRADEWGADLIVVGTRGAPRSDASFSAVYRKWFPPCLAALYVSHVAPSTEVTVNVCESLSLWTDRLALNWLSAKLAGACGLRGPRC